MRISIAVLAEDFTEQASVSNWPLRLALVAVMIAAIALALWGMRRGWKARAGRQAAIAEPPLLIESDIAGLPGISGLYVGSATAGQWLDRIAVHDLGVRSRATFFLSHRGLTIERESARSFVIPSQALRQVRADRGVAGTVRGKDSVVVVTWVLGDHLIDTGIRADDGAENGALLDGLMAIVPSDVADDLPDSSERTGQGRE